MNVVIVNESKGKSWLRSRRVLSKYLPQLGSQTWAGAITEEGLAELKNALLASKVSKSSAIVCHRVVSRSRMEVEWVLGARHWFDEAGRYAFRTAKARHSYADGAPAKAPAAERWLLAVLRLSALAHDLGKSNAAFQRKLRAGTGFEELRHELVSFLMVAQSCASTTSALGQVQDREWLKLLADKPASLCGCVSGPKLLPDFEASDWFNFIRKASTPPDGKSQGSLLLPESRLAPLFANAPSVAAVLWLVLTHHRLPEGCQESESWFSGAHSRFGGEAAPWKKCVTVDKAALDDAPWHDQGWLQAVSQAAKQALEALDELEAQSNVQEVRAALPILLAHALRPALVLADHIGSHAADVTGSKSEPSLAARLFANTRDDEFCDPLTTHLLKVSKWSRQIWNLLHRPKEAYPHAQATPFVQALSQGRFAWQQELQGACERNREVPAFVAVLAETGAGKTLAAAKALHGLQGERLRANWALGLRSLTFQTGQELAKSAGFSESDVAVAVGQAHTQRLNAEESVSEKPVLDGTEVPAQDVPPALWGSESSEDPADLLVDDAPAAVTHSEDLLNLVQAREDRAVIEKHWMGKTLRLLSTPFLVCTVDHLVYSAAPQRGADAKLYLRHAHADLVLDEIDAYGPSDLQALGKLIFCAGLHQRNVVLLSATATPSLLQGLHQAWRRGVAAGQALKGQPLRSRAILAANMVPAQEVLDCDEAAFAQAQTIFCAQVVRVLAERAHEGRLSRKLGVLAVSGSRTNAYRQVLDKAVQLHEAHATDIDGVRLSTGFVELNTAAAAAGMAKFLAQELVARSAEPGGSDWPVIKLVTYHAKYPRAYLAELDARLKELCTRKQGAPELTELKHALTQAPDVRGNPKGVCVLVCTTTLMETGRDFDFDWAVLEPRSVRGVIQAAGRVRRHRGGVATQENVVLMDRPLASLDTPDSPDKWWARPGVTDLIANAKLSEKAEDSFFFAPSGAQSTTGRSSRTLKPSRVVQSAIEALPVLTWQAALDATVCLTDLSAPSQYAANRIGCAEQFAQKTHLLGGHQGITPLNAYLDGRLFKALTDWHGKQYVFRGKDTASLSFVPPGLLHKTSVVGDCYSKAWYFDEKSKKFRSAPHVESVCFQDAFKLQFLLPNLEQLALNRLTERFKPSEWRDPALVGVGLRADLDKGATYKAAWHPLLGFFKAQ